MIPRSRRGKLLGFLIAKDFREAMIVSWNYFLPCSFCFVMGLLCQLLGYRRLSPFKFNPLSFPEPWPVSDSDRF